MSTFLAIIIIIGALAFAGTCFGLGIGYFGAQVYNLSDDFGKVVFKVCGIILLIDIVIILITSPFVKKRRR